MNDLIKSILKSVVKTVGWFALLIIAIWLVIEVFRKPSTLRVGLVILYYVGLIYSFTEFFDYSDTDHKNIKIKIKDWIGLEIGIRQFAILIAILSVSLGIWLTHKENNSIRHEKLMNKGEFTDKPTYISQDEWELIQGIGVYRKKHYDLALKHFSKISSLNGPQFVRWKFYQTISKLRILEHKKFRMLEPIDENELKHVIYTLKNLVEQYPNDVLAESINYWYAQTIYHFRGESEKALKIFVKLREQYKWGQWKQGCILYSAEILAKRNNLESLLESERLLNWLMLNSPNGLVRIIIRGRDYRVKSVVPERFQKVQELISELKNVN